MLLLLLLLLSDVQIYQALTSSSSSSTYIPAPWRTALLLADFLSPWLSLHPSIALFRFLLSLQTDLTLLESGKTISISSTNGAFPRLEDLKLLDVCGTRTMHVSRPGYMCC